MAPAPVGAKAVFALTWDSIDYESPRSDDHVGRQVQTILSTLLRSDDLGSNWSIVNQWHGAIPRQLVLPLSWQSNGFAYLLVDEELYRSSDRAHTWAPVALNSDVFVQSLWLSPNFDEDRTLYARTIQKEPENGDTPSRFVVSYDAGDTWADVGRDAFVADDGHDLSVAGAAVSPSFREDRTLFVQAIEPCHTSIASAPRIDGTLYRSQDGGGTWQPVRHIISACNSPWSISLSSHFSDDRSITVGSWVSGPTRGEEMCDVAASQNGGDTWSTVEAGRLAYGSCPRVRNYMVAGRSVFFRGRTVSVDGGRTWLPVSLPTSDGGSSSGSLDGAPYADAVSAGGSLFASWSGEVFAMGPVSETRGTTSCRYSPAATFAGVLSANPSVVDQLGCAIEEERIVTFHERQLSSPDNVLSLWTDDDKPIWLALYNGVSWGRGPESWTGEESPSSTGPSDPYQDVSGSVQRFEGGVLLRLRLSVGNETILALADKVTEYHTDR